MNDLAGIFALLGICAWVALVAYTEGQRAFYQKTKKQLENGERPLWLYPYLR